MNKLNKKVLLISMLAIMILLSACGDTTKNEEEKNSYPEKDITMIIPFSAGGTNDTAGRVFSEFLGKHLDTTVVVENKPGAGGVTQTTEFVKEEPDGYTLQFSADDPFTIQPALNDNLNYSINDFDFLSVPLTASTVLAVNSDSPYETVEEFFDGAKNNDEIIKFSHPGVGTNPHLAGELTFEETNIDSQQIPYDGGGQAMNALLSNDVDAQFTPEATILAQVDEGNIRPLAVTSSEKSPYIDVPTMQDLGYDVDMSPLMMVFAPKGLPDNVKDELDNAIQEVLEDPEFIETAEDLNLTIDGRDGKELVDYIESLLPEIEKVADVIE